jgi:hypothetical protein
VATTHVTGCFLTIMGSTETEISLLVNLSTDRDANMTGSNKLTTNYPTNELTLCSWVLLKGPPVVQPLKKFPVFYGTQRFITSLTTALHRSCQSQPTQLDHSNYIWWRPQATQLLVMQFSPPSCHIKLLQSKFSPQYLFPNTFSLCSSINARDQASHPYRTICKL